MGYIEFDKTQLINLEYSLNKEMVRSNRAGSFSCTTILGCNTRKYHGLLICPQPELDGERHVLLSKVDETVIQRDTEFNLGINRFPGTFLPKGHKYVRNFSAELIPMVTYRVGGVVLTKETMFVSHQEQVMIRYTLVEAHSPTRLRLRPFLAFRSMHSLSRQNIGLNTRYEAAPNGISVQMYPGYPHLHMQFSKKAVEYIHAPDWFKDFEYTEEKERGYESHEDLYNPGFFECDIKKGESVIFSASTTGVNPLSITRHFNKELGQRTPRNSFENCLINSAEQFYFRHHGKTGIIAGYPWYGSVGRYTFISLPGLSLYTSVPNLADSVYASMIKNMQGPFFREYRTPNETSYASADTSLWFFWSLQKTHRDLAAVEVWRKYGKVMKSILEGYALPNANGIALHDNGLLFIDPMRPALTWMNAYANNYPVTPRAGYVSEVNALWYNALHYATDLARASGDKAFLKKWEPLMQLAGRSFESVFWNDAFGYLADCVYEENWDLSVRPNQLICAAMPFSPLNEQKRKKVLDIVQKELLTPRGIRSLSPRDSRYKGHYSGDHTRREECLHQGTAWPWLLGMFADAWITVYKDAGMAFLYELLNNFQEVMKEHGIGSISEIYDGDPPYKPNGAISFAPGVAEILRIVHMTSKKKFNKRKK